MGRRLSAPLLIGLPLLLLAAGGAAGWFMADGNGNESDSGTEQDVAASLPTDFDAVAPLRPLDGAPNPIDTDASQVIGTSVHEDASAIDVAADAALEMPLVAGAAAVAVDPTTLQPAAPVAVSAIVATGSTSISSPTGAPATAPTAQVREIAETVAGDSPDPLRVATTFAATGVFAALCNEVEAGNVPDPQLTPALRPTLAVLVNQPATVAISGTWADGSPLEKTTMRTLPAHDAEWRRLFEEGGEQRPLVACLSLPADEVRQHSLAGVAQLRASVLAISATGQAELNATVTIHTPAETDDPLFVDRVTVTHRGEQRRADGILYPTLHVHYSFLADAVVAIDAPVPAQNVRVIGEHAFVEGADCTGWAVNQQGIDRAHSGRFSVTTETRAIAGSDRIVTVVDGEVYLEPNLPGGWQGAFCVRLQATDEFGAQRATLALHGAQVRSPRTATYEVGVLLNDAAVPDGQSMNVTWTSASAVGCTSTTVTRGSGTQCTFSARWVPDGIGVSINVGDTDFAIHVPVNTGYCNPDDPLESGNGCEQGFSLTYPLPVPVTLQVIRTAAPGTLWDDPSNAWLIGPIT